MAGGKAVRLRADAHGGGVQMTVIGLRPVEDGDLDSLFEQMRDPEGVWMAAFTPVTMPPHSASFKKAASRQ
jgi:hypothetical protein